MRQRKQEQGQKSELRAVKRAADAIEITFQIFGIDKKPLLYRNTNDCFKKFIHKAWSKP